MVSMQVVRVALLVDEERVSLSMELAEAVENIGAEVSIHCASDVKVRWHFGMPELSLQEKIQHFLWYSWASGRP